MHALTHGSVCVCVYACGQDWGMDGYSGSLPPMQEVLSPTVVCVVVCRSNRACVASRSAAFAVLVAARLTDLPRQMWRVS